MLIKVLTKMEVQEYVYVRGDGRLTQQRTLVPLTTMTRNKRGKEIFCLLHRWEINISFTVRMNDSDSSYSATNRSKSPLVYTSVLEFGFYCHVCLTSNFLSFLSILCIKRRFTLRVIFTNLNLDSCHCYDWSTSVSLLFRNEHDS